ncbi:MAG: aspartate-semialdehyde dehydrogenase [Actinomycetota bacterium]
MNLPEHPHVAVVGATGVVGRVMLGILRERGFPASQVTPLASARSAGKEIAYGDTTLVVRELSAASLQGVDLALLDTPDEVARAWAPVAVEAGAVAVDNSAAWRMEDHVPLVVPEVNAHALEGHPGIVASPNCTTIGVVLPLAAIHAAFGLESVVVASYQAVSGAGEAGVDELKEQVAKLAFELDAMGAGDPAGLSPEPRAFPAPIAFNVVPKAGSVKELGYTSEEWKLLHETRKIMGLPGLNVTATCVRVPTVTGHGAAVHVRCASEVDLGAAMAALGAAPGVTVTDLPTAVLAAGRDDSFVGRVRVDPGDPRALWFFCTCDNLRKGAALNAVQIAEHLLPS